MSSRTTNHFEHDPSNCAYCRYLGEYGTAKLYMCLIDEHWPSRITAPYANGRLFVVSLTVVMVHGLASSIHHMDSPVGLIAAKERAISCGLLSPDGVTAVTNVDGDGDALERFKR